jgi:uncharacterized protein (TIGR01777 family)
MSGRVVLAGGSGFLGRSLAGVLTGRGYEVVVLTRDNPATEGAIRFEQWDGRTLGDWGQLLEGAVALVNLTGKSVNCRYTADNRREILASRVDSVRVLGQAMAGCAEPPRVWVQAGSLAFYGHTADRWCDENSAQGEGFSADVCRQWESTFAALDLPQTRKVLLRIGFALARNEGALKTLERLTRCFLGGAVGSGRQFISWIHIADLNRMFAWAIEREELAGVFNATGPNPMTNTDFMRELRRALHRPWSPPVPAPIARLGALLMGTEADLALHGFRGTPKRFLEHGFEFEYPQLGRALHDLYELDKPA